MKIFIILLVVVIVLLGGAGAGVYLGYIPMGATEETIDPEGTEKTASAEEDEEEKKDPEVPTDPDALPEDGVAILNESDMSIYEGDPLVKKPARTDMVKMNKITETREYSDFDFSDPKERYKAGDQVIREMSEQRKAGDEEEVKKKRENKTRLRRAKAIEVWIRENK